MPWISLEWAFVELLKVLGEDLKPSLIAQLVKNLPATQETQVRFLGREDPLEKELAAHSSILAWRLPRMGEHGGLQSTGSQRVGCTEARAHTTHRKVSDWCST